MYKYLLYSTICLFIILPTKFLGLHLSTNNTNAHKNELIQKKSIEANEKIVFVNYRFEIWPK